MTDSSISGLDPETLLAVLGARDRHLRRIRDALGVSISSSDGRLEVSGEEEDAVTRAMQVLQSLCETAKRRGAVDDDDVSTLLRDDGGEFLPDANASLADVLISGRAVRPRTAGQQRYVQAIEQNDVVLCDGPAGTGKTYLAVAAAVAALKAADVRRIVLVRPAVEAGESLGFLPGDMAAKINPYLRPLLDALRDMMDPELVKRYTEQGVIEVVPLAYMRGRTLNDSFIILDEAQNTTIPQMKMFLTRMGFNSKVVAAGDGTQVDLPDNCRSGFNDALHRLKGIKRIATVKLGKRDIVRHRLVQQIVERYEATS